MRVLGDAARPVLEAAGRAEQDRARVDALRLSAARRRGRLSFLQALCDMNQRGEDMISAYERSARGGAPFESVMRLRADLFWEASCRYPCRC